MAIGLYLRAHRALAQSLSRYSYDCRVSIPVHSKIAMIRGHVHVPTFLTEDLDRRRLLLRRHRMVASSH